MNTIHRISSTFKTINGLNKYIDLSPPSIIEKIENKDFVKFEDLFDFEEQKIGLVVTFLAILELMKELLIEIVQAKEFGTIHVKVLVDKK